MFFKPHLVILSILPAEHWRHSNVASEPTLQSGIGETWLQTVLLLALRASASYLHCALPRCEIFLHPGVGGGVGG